MSFFTSPDYSHWSWLVLGLLLAGIELLIPGVFIIWFAVAAFLTGILDFIFALSWQSAFIVFSILSPISVFAGRAIDRKNHTAKDPSELSDTLMGQTFMLTESIQNGYGRIRVADSSWRVQSTESLLKGAHVRVVGTSPDKTTLLVKSADL